MSDEQKARRHKFDPKLVEPDGMTYEEYQATMDKMWPGMAEPDGEGIDLRPDDPRWRFIATSESVIFSQAPPLNRRRQARSGPALGQHSYARNQHGYCDPKEEEDALNKL